MTKAHKILSKIDESSLSRLYSKMKEYNCGTITAFRDARDCGKGTKYTKKENLARNKSLLAKLMTKHYGVTRVKGYYIENYNTPYAIEVGKTVFLVMDLHDTGNLRRDLLRLGEEFKQDSILFVPKSGKQGTLIGAGKCPESYPGFHKTDSLKNPIFGEKGEFYTRVNGRPFVLEESVEEIHPPQNVMGKYAMSIAARRPWNMVSE
jgi:hypothetical protein